MSFGAEVSLKRFWKTVGIEKTDDNYVVTLDKRPLKTPSGNKLLIPPTKRLTATLVATEWENQEVVLKQHSLPMTSITSRAIDAFQEEETRKEVRAQLLKYLQTDTLCFHESEPENIARLQQEHWDPLIKWAEESFGVKINIARDSFVLPPHPKETLQKFDEHMTTFDPWQMAALERAVYSSKSFIIGLALIHKRITVEQAAQAAHVEVNSQIEKWGEVEDSHDVDYHDIRRQLGSAACLVSNL
ncbi:ATP12-domain-containing protein [Abortiporus biennis]|nr:ATP12-domain-containing protein [Abortiporus biennis]